MKALKNCRRSQIAAKHEAPARCQPHSCIVYGLWALKSRTHPFPTPSFPSFIRTPMIGRPRGAGGGVGWGRGEGTEAKLYKYNCH
jgi:hypothetical protein